MTQPLHPQLAKDCYKLGRLASCTLLLHKNAHVPWMILVPDTPATELFHMPPGQQESTHAAINQLALFIEQHYSTDKLNIATLGNLVPQLHIHIIGRFRNDPWWPAPVWGQPGFKDYTESEVTEIRQSLVAARIPALLVD